ncbi:hypothetical protein [Chondrinema litorale]|uniref:hypothetical protein n=1 Tax=Chondrinema litorale TaxID=2994555 RepID=UPI002542E144|nr:hypothetical protein [Chondrinema litorale]UZR96295.1 hypothetical protein OQ292_21795 [Chondrinema litorale]
MDLDQKIIDTINRQFTSEEVPFVINELASLKMTYVRQNNTMAASKENLLNTQQAILKLAKGNVNDVAELIQCAKVDFRDVIMWAMMEGRKKKNTDS